jgi:membrane-associated phospholipid phosphatase
MKLLLALVLLLLGLPLSAWGEEPPYSLSQEFSEGLSRLGHEGVEVVTAPFSWEGLLGTLATAGAVGLTFAFDQDIRADVQGIQSSSLDKAADVGSFLGNPLFQLGVAGAVYAGGIFADSPKYQELGEMLGESAILADAVTFVLKQAIGRARPSLNRGKDSFRPFQFANDYDSLPSMHSASSFAFASVLAATSESLLAKLAYYTAATFVGFSRIYQDKHWASDVVLGAVIGELCGRVVTSYHATRGQRRLAIVPAASRDGVGMALVARW